MQTLQQKRRPLDCETLGRFIRLPENRAARLACSDLLRNLRQSQPATLLTYLHGRSGSGKSHLARVLIERASRVGDVRILAARDLGRVLAGQTIDADATMKRDWRRCRLLVIEDIQHLSPTTAAAVVSLLDARQRRGRSTLVTASVGPLSLRDLPARLTSRLAAGLVVQMRVPGTLSLLRLANHWCRKQAFALDAPTLAWLVDQSDQSVRPLFGNLARLQQLSQHLPTPPNLETARRLFGSDETDNRQPLEAIAEAVAAWFHLSVREIRGRNRQPSILWPRQIAQYVARKRTSLSLAAIGAYFGACDHSTVLNALRKVDARLSQDDGLARIIVDLTS